MLVPSHQQKHWVLYNFATAAPLVELFCVQQALHVARGALSPQLLRCPQSPPPLRHLSDDHWHSTPGTVPPYFRALASSVRGILWIRPLGVRPLGDASYLRIHFVVVVIVVQGCSGGWGCRHTHYVMFQLPDASSGSPFLRAQRYVIVIVIIIVSIVSHNSGYGWP